MLTLLLKVDMPALILIGGSTFAQITNIEALIRYMEKRLSDSNPRIWQESGKLRIYFSLGRSDVRRVTIYFDCPLPVDREFARALYIPENENPEDPITNENYTGYYQQTTPLDGVPSDGELGNISVGSVLKDFYECDIGGCYETVANFWEHQVIQRLTEKISEDTN